MKIAFNELPYYQDFLDSTDARRRVQIVQDYCNVLLKLSDWTVLQYSPTDTVAWNEYRNQIRLLAATYDPANDNPVFPTEPETIIIQPVPTVEEIGENNVE